MKISAVVTCALLGHLIGRLKDLRRLGAYGAGIILIVFKNAKGFLISMTNWLSH